MDQALVDATLESASDLASLLGHAGRKIVFAESCTAGLISAAMGSVSGISDRLCGSAVTYRESVKRDWLGIDAQLVDRYTAVSAEVTRAMATAVLHRTAEADYSVAVTGHLEPPQSRPGAMVFLSLGYHQSGTVVVTEARQILLRSETRIARQWEAARTALEMAAEQIGRLETAAGRKSEFVN